MLVVLGLLFVAVDRISAWIAGRVLADQVARELTNYEVNGGQPDVSVGGFPFLTQVVSGEYAEVTLHLRDVGADAVQLSDVEIVASDVTAPMSTLIERSGPIHAGRVDGTAIVGYDSVAAFTGLDGLELSAAGRETVAVRMPVDVLGTSVALAGSASVGINGNTLHMRVTELAADNSVDLPAEAQAQVDQLASAASVDVPLPALPYDLSVDSARAESTGLAVDLSANDVPLSR
ncbi:LmeA family phospholipid-binding protein [Phytoactinopolyspora mesophila]|uniref:LmeA family phospholipid-binding protein n=1 Tax=Phytoactinopolyspora mesophila TaxID=2650750 RepID=UPI001391EE8C